MEEMIMRMIPTIVVSLYLTLMSYLDNKRFDKLEKNQDNMLKIFINLQNQINKVANNSN